MREAGHLDADDTIAAKDSVQCVEMHLGVGNAVVVPCVDTLGGGELGFGGVDRVDGQVDRVVALAAVDDGVLTIVAALGENLVPRGGEGAAGNLGGVGHDGARVDSDGEDGCRVAIQEEQRSVAGVDGAVPRQGTADGGVDGLDDHSLVLTDGHRQAYKSH